jgi:hypothetical protein
VRRALLIGTTTVAVALAAAAATWSAPPPKEAACGEALVIVLFWSHGHGSIPSVGFSADRKPHLEIYKYGTHGYPRANFLAYANSKGTARFRHRVLSEDRQLPERAGLEPHHGSAGPCVQLPDPEHRVHLGAELQGPCPGRRRNHRLQGHLGQAAQEGLRARLQQKRLQPW